MSFVYFVVPPDRLNFLLFRGHPQTTPNSTPSSHPSLLAPHIPNALTVDVEDYFQVSAFSDRVCRSTWDSLECRVEASTDKLLSIFDQCEVRGTFFILGWVAERYPKLVRRIAAAGHELASHGYWHQLVYDLTPEEFSKDIQDSKEAIADATGIVVTAYRAPSFSITEESSWALQILAENDIDIDSSIFPISGHDRYGVADATKEIHDIETPSGTIREFPPSAWSRGRLHAPIGGGYFRLFPLALTLRAIEAVRQEGRPAMFYTHPWELDPDQPRVSQLGYKNRFRHYVGLAQTENKLRRMLEAAPFDSLTNVITATEPIKIGAPANPRQTQRV